MISIKRLFSAPFWRSVLLALYQTFQRFPLAMLSIIVIYLLVVGDMHHIHWLRHFTENTMLLLFSGLFVISTGSILMAENYSWNTIKTYLIMGFFVVLYAIRILLFPKFDLETILLLFAIVLPVTFVVYLNKKEHNNSAWLFNFKILSAVFFALFAALILSAGLSLILVSLEYLFEFKIAGYFYGDIWLSGFVLFAPLYILSQLPKQFYYESEDCQFPRGIHFILNYLVIPLLLIYAIILYSYFIKILIQWELPRGNLAWMISIFGVLGILSHLFVYPLNKTKNSLMHWFYCNFYRLMAIPLLLLIIAIAIRVNQYGLTENRYLVIVSALWFATLIIINIIKRDKFQLTTVTLALSILLLFSSFGPQGITQLPTNLQISHLKKLLKQNNILVENSIVKNKVQLPFEQAKSITSSVNYIMRKRKAELFRPYFSDRKAFNKALYCVSGKPCQSRNAGALLKLMGVRVVNSWQRKSDVIATNINLEPIKCCGFNAVKVSGYDFLVQINWYRNTIKQKLGFEDELMNRMKWKIELHGFNLTVSAENQKDVILSLNTLLARFPEGKPTKVPRNQKQQLTLLGENNKYQLTLLTERLTLNTRDKKPSIESFKGILYIKIKDISKN